ncbi:MAG: DUF808 domain-containing protein, partial [Sulfitobacter sp.]|nr:DUF808 domain-containing protein [Sulfitobacter sp.]
GHLIHDWSVVAAHAVPPALEGATEWASKAVMDGILGLVLGLMLIPIGEKIVTPLWRSIFSRKSRSHA